MPITLYDAFVPSCLQIIGAVRALVDTAEAWCGEKGHGAGEIADARLCEDMLPFAYQVKSVAVHSFGAIEGVRKGVFSPDMTPPPATFAEMRDVLDTAVAGLKAVTPEEMEGFIGGDAIFSMPSYNVEMPFTAENFLLSFSQPNFYFHATTAYAIMRNKGIEIGKRDFLGAMRLKVPA